MRTKKLLRKTMLIIGLCALVICMTGCISVHVQSPQEEPSFSSSQQERQAYVHDFLLEQYGVDCDVSEVRQR